MLLLLVIVKSCREH